MNVSFANFYAVKNQSLGARFATDSEIPDWTISGPAVRGPMVLALKTYRQDAFAP